MRFPSIRCPSLLLPVASIVIVLASVPIRAADTALQLKDAAIGLHWSKTAAGWALDSCVVQTAAGRKPFGQSDGSYILLFSQTAPDSTPQLPSSPAHPGGFPESYHKFILPRWEDANRPVALNTAGQAYRFLPHSARLDGNALEFSGRTEVADVSARWELDPAQPGDARVTLTLMARRDGWFSLATPTLAILAPVDLAWAMVPGYFQGANLEPDFILAYGYAHGLPERPVVVRERAASTLAPLMTNRAGITLAVVPEPGTAGDPWEKDTNTRPQTWRLGLSHMNRDRQLSPTLYAPVLGEAGSHLKAGESVTLHFRYVVREGDWFSVLKYTARSIYHLRDFIAMKQPHRSISDRLVALRDYVTNDVTSQWRTETFGPLTLGAQAYISAGVRGSDNDAMKNSDYGAMWMLARMTGDLRIVRDRLPYARNFKLAQQQVAPGFFQGAAMGQYYLSKSQRFTEEWGNYVEPVALTYYALLDMGNILLFDPEDAEMRERLRLGADRLLSWQHPAGNWEVAYNRDTHAPMFQDLPDLRPTFYGLVVAYRVLGDDKYLAGARRAADWLLANAIKPGRFLGVCGDTRFAPDFATAQIAQALLDLYDLTGDPHYREGGIAAARFYTASIYTHPLASNAEKQAGGVPRKEWEINQSGLSFEHGGTLGSANGSGPILLASHSGLFVRMARLTGDDYYLDLARAGVWARDAFVEPITSVASYYWATMNRGPAGFPHHGWWQIGWITDYLLAEAEYRSRGAVQFPRGFFTPKVGSHVSYGFAPGKIFGRTSELRWGAAKSDRHEIDSILAESANDGSWQVVLLNNSLHPVNARVQIDAAALTGGRRSAAWKSIVLLDAGGNAVTQDVTSSVTVSLPAAGLAVIVLQ